MRNIQLPSEFFCTWITFLCIDCVRQVVYQSSSLAVCSILHYVDCFCCVVLYIFLPFVPQIGYFVFNSVFTVRLLTDFFFIYIIAWNTLNMIYISIFVAIFQVNHQNHGIFSGGDKKYRRRIFPSECEKENELKEFNTCLVVCCISFWIVIGIASKQWK